MSEEQKKEEVQEEETVSTTESLFPDLAEEEKKENETEAKPEVKAEGEQPEEKTPQPEQSSPDKSYVDMDKMGNMFVKEIVNGKEVDVPLSDLVGADRKNRAAEEKFQEAARIRREAAEERQRLEQERLKFSQPQVPQQSQVPDPDNQNQNNYPGKTEADQYFTKMMEQAAPILIEANKKRMRDKFDDFDDVFPKMQEFVAKMENTPENDRQIQYFDKDPQGQELLYYKAKQMMASDLKKSPPPPEKKSAPMERPVPPVVKVAPGTSVSSTANDQSAEIVAARKKAMKTGRDEDWARVISLMTGT